jgi:hypothetical protein
LIHTYAAFWEDTPIGSPLDEATRTLLTGLIHMELYRYQHAEAERWLQRLPKDDESIDVLLARAHHAEKSGLFDHAQVLYTRCREHPQIPWHLLFSACTSQCWVHLRQGEFSAARSLSQQMIERSESGDHYSRGFFTFLKTSAELGLGQQTSVQRQLQQSLEAMQALQQPHAEQIIRSCQADALLASGQRAQAEAVYRACLWPLWQQRDLGRVLHGLTQLGLICEDLTAAARLAGAVVQLGELIGYQRAITESTAWEALKDRVSDCELPEEPLDLFLREVTVMLSVMGE